MNSIDLHGVIDEIENDSPHTNALKTAYDAFNEAYEIFNDPKFNSKSDWKKETSCEGGIVYSKFLDYGKAFVLTGEVPIAWEEMLREEWEDVGKIPEWNPNIAFAKIEHTLTQNFDIVHYANADLMVVKGRDFVVSRLKRVINGRGYIAAKSVELNEFPETPSHVRGCIHIGSGRFSPHPTKPNTTVIDYLLCIDLKGYIPKMLINTVMAKLVIKDFESTRAHFEAIKNGKH